MPSTIRNDGIKYEKQVGHVDSTINSIGIFSLTNESVGNWGNDDSPINFEVLHLPHGFGLHRFHLAPQGGSVFHPVSPTVPVRRMIQEDALIFI